MQADAEADECENDRVQRNSRQKRAEVDLIGGKFMECVEEQNGDGEHTAGDENIGFREKFGSDMQ